YTVCSRPGFPWTPSPLLICRFSNLPKRWTRQPCSAAPTSASSAISSTMTTMACAPSNPSARPTSAIPPGKSKIAEPTCDSPGAAPTAGASRSSPMCPSIVICRRIAPARRGATAATGHRSRARRPRTRARGHRPSRAQFLGPQDAHLPGEHRSPGDPGQLWRHYRGPRRHRGVARRAGHRHARHRRNRNQRLAPQGHERPHPQRRADHLLEHLLARAKNPPGKERALRRLHSPQPGSRHRLLMRLLPLPRRHELIVFPWSCFGTRRALRGSERFIMRLAGSFFLVLAATAQVLTLQDGTPVRLRLNRTVSSANVHVGETVDFEVTEPVINQNYVIIPKGAVALG